MKYELLESPTDPGAWHVEAFDDEGECIKAVFSGPFALERAERYAIAESERNPPKYIDFRGVRFFAPYYCFRCAKLVTARQFQFSRSCGGCDVSASQTALLPVLSRELFAGRYELLEGDTQDLAGYRIISVDSLECRKLIKRGPTAIRPPIAPAQWPFRPQKTQPNQYRQNRPGIPRC